MKSSEVVLEQVVLLQAWCENALHVSFKSVDSLFDGYDLHDVAVSMQSRNSSKSFRRRAGDGVSKMSVSFRRINRLRVVSIQKVSTCPLCVSEWRTDLSQVFLTLADVFQQEEEITASSQLHQVLAALFPKTTFVHRLGIDL